MRVNSYLVELRREIIEVITGVKNANGSFYWDNSTPNFATKRNLVSLYDKYFSIASKMYGIYKVTRHTSCPNEDSHLMSTEFPTTNEYGLSVQYGDDNFKWTGYQYYQGERECSCPLCPNDKVTKHRVIDDLIYDKSKVVSVNRDELIKALYCILMAIDNSKPKAARSSIRECLLEAVLIINDQILPMPIESFISENSLN